MCIKITVITISSCIVIASIIIVIFFGIKYNTQRIVQSGSIKHICNSTAYSSVQHPEYCTYNPTIKIRQCFPPKCEVFIKLECDDDTNPTIHLDCTFYLCTNKDSFNYCVKDTPLNTTYNIFSFKNKKNLFYLESAYNKIVQEYKNLNLLPVVISFAIAIPFFLTIIIVTSISFCCWCF